MFCYDHEHWLTQEGCGIMANRYVELIEQTRSEITPQTGDRLIYLSRHGDYYGNALIDSMDERKACFPSANSRMSHSYGNLRIISA